MVKFRVQKKLVKLLHLNMAVLFVLTSILSSGYLLLFQNEQAAAISVNDTSTGFDADASNGVTVTTPAGTATGDLLILFMHHGAGNLDLESEWGQSGSGWTFERAQAITGTSNESSSAWYRTATAGDAGGSGSYTFTVTTPIDAVRWVVVAVQDHNGFDVSEGYNDTDVTTSPSVSDSITPTEDGALLLAFVAKDDNDGQTTASWANVQSMTTEESHNNEGTVMYTSVFSETLSGTGAVTRDFNLAGTNIDGTAKQIMVTINPALAVPATNLPILTQEGYIFENDDGVNADSNSQQAAGNTPIEGVRKGEKVNLRMQLSNSEAALDSELGLFYQKDGGFWTQVKHGGENIPSTESLTNSNSGLVGWWEFDGDTTDSTSFGNDGTISGTVTLTTDRFGNADSAYSFNGSTGSYITTTNQTGYDEFSISAWVYNTDGTTGDVRTIVSNSRDCGAPACGTTNRGFNLSGTYFDNEPRFGLFNSSDGVIYGIGDVGGAGTPANDWVHYTGTYDGSTIRLYRNGVLYDSFAFSQSSMGTPSAPIRIGNLGSRTDYPWLGKIDDVRYYNRALTSSEVNVLASDCNDTGWTCSTIDNYMHPFQHVTAAISPETGTPWSVYMTNFSDLGIARYVGEGGNGCNGANTRWSCEIIDTAEGRQSSIAFEPGGKAWVSYTGDGADLWIAEFVGSGGSGCAGGNTAWSCSELLVGDFESTAIATDKDGKVYVSAVDGVAGDIYIVEQVGSGGSGCASGTVYNCVVLDNAIGTPPRGASTSTIVIDDNNNPNVIYEDESAGIDAKLVHAEYVGTSGTGCTSSAWTCTIVAVDSESNNHIDAALSPDGNIWISYGQPGDANLSVARYVGSGGNCDTAEGGSDAWECTNLDTSNTAQGTSIEFDAGGQAIVTYSYNDGVNLSLHYARYVGSGGSGCSDAAWDGCSILYDDANNIRYTSTAIDATGKVWVFFTNENSSDLMVAIKKINQYITPATSSAISATDSLTESHVDMTSVTDSTNRDDSDCLAAGGNWNNGVFSYNGLTNLSLPDGSSTVQCSEITFGISTASATDGNYRFALAFKDRTKSSKSYWRGVSQIDEYPTMGVIDEPGVRFSKGVTPIFTDCSGGNGEWGCEVIVDNGSSLGRFGSIIVDNDGVAWATAPNDAGDGWLVIAKYVGSGGNCDTLYTGGSDRWQCEVVFDETLASTDDGYYSSSAINPLTNKPSFAFTATTSGTTAKIVIADYVGSGGTGCTGGSSAYNCTVIMNPGYAGFGEGTSIQFSPSGVPSVAFRESAGGDVWFARYVGQGGNCDDDYSGSDAWSCEQIVTTGLVGNNLTLVYDNDGIPWIATGNNDVNDDLFMIKYVGSGGTNCGNSAWQCWLVVDDINVSGSTEGDMKITIDKDNNVWASYQDISVADSSLRVAKYVGSGGTGCNDVAWTCTLVDSVTGDDMGTNIAMGTDKSGYPMVVYQTAEIPGTFNDIRFARYVGSGGTGCDSSAWEGCETIYAKNGAGRDISLTLDDNGLVWVVHRDETDDDLSLIKQHFPQDILYNSNTNISQNSNVANATDLIYAVTDGRSPRSLENGACGSGLSNLLGYCGMLENDGGFDSITAAANERPFVTAAVGFTTNTEMPLVNWVGRSNIAPNTASTAGDIHLEIYRYGSTNAWEALATDTTSSNCNTADCLLSGTSSGPPSEYFRLEDGIYWFNVRIYQKETSSSMTLKTDELSARITGQRLRNGRSFEGGSARPFVTE
jgi:hypothetical protein